MSAVPIKERRRQHLAVNKVWLAFQANDEKALAGAIRLMVGHDGLDYLLSREIPEGDGRVAPWPPSGPEIADALTDRLAQVLPLRRLKSSRLVFVTLTLPDAALKDGVRHASSFAEGFEGRWSGAFLVAEFAKKTQRLHFHGFVLTDLTNKGLLRRWERQAGGMPEL